MADLTRIQFKRSKTPNVRPAPDTVAEGEIILNLADRAILTKLGNEIIDLGFAKGGKVDGNIDLTGNFDQKNGNIVTTGSITANQESTINAPFNINDNIKIKDPNKPDNFAALAYTTGKLYYEQFVDGKWTGQFIIPQGAGTAASREWVNRMVNVESNDTTILRNPNGTNRLCLVTKNTGEAGSYDFANNRWAFVHNQAGMSIYGQTTILGTNDYANIRLKKLDGRYVQIETKPHAGSVDMLAFVYKQADGTNQHVITMPYADGTLATREWTNTMVKDLGNGVGMASPRGTTEIANNDDGNMGFWDKTTSRWLFVVHPNNADLSTVGLTIKNRTPGGDQSRVELISPDARHAIGLYTYNDGRNLLSAKNANGSWTNIRISDAGFDLPVSLRLTGGDYAGLQMMRSDGTYTRIEQNPISSAALLTIAGRAANGGNQHVLSVPRETGTLATQSWVNGQGFQKGSGVLRSARNYATYTGLDANSWGNHTRGIRFGINLDNKIVYVESPFLGNGVLMGRNVRGILVTTNASGSTTTATPAWLEDDYVKFPWSGSPGTVSQTKIVLMEFY